MARKRGPPILHVRALCVAALACALAASVCAFLVLPTKPESLPPERLLIHLYTPPPFMVPKQGLTRVTGDETSIFLEELVHTLLLRILQGGGVYRTHARARPPHLFPNVSLPDLEVVVLLNDSANAQLHYVPLYSQRLVPNPRKDVQQKRKLQAAMWAWLRNQTAWQRVQGVDHVLTHDMPSEYLRSYARAPFLCLVTDPRLDVQLNLAGHHEIVCPRAHFTLPYIVHDVAVNRLAHRAPPLSARSIFAYMWAAKEVRMKTASKLRQRIMDEMRSDAACRLHEYDRHRDSPTFFDPAYPFVEDMTHSIFCPCPRGDTPTTRRFFSAALLGCIPVVVADHIALPFSDVIDYSQFSLQFAEEDVLAQGLLPLLRNVSSATVAHLSTNLQSAGDLFKWPVEDDQELSCPLLDLLFHALWRYSQSLHGSAARYLSQRCKYMADIPPLD